jgi:hypothetical protein
MTWPLTPAEAIAIAALLGCDKRLADPWRDVAARLRTWGQQNQTEHEEGEMPSQDRFRGSAGAKLGSRNRAALQGAETPGGPNRSTSTELAGDEQL